MSELNLIKSLKDLEVGKCYKMYHNKHQLNSGGRYIGKYIKSEFDGQAPGEIYYKYIFSKGSFLETPDAFEKYDIHTELEEVPCANEESVGGKMYSRKLKKRKGRSIKKHNKTKSRKSRKSSRRGKR